MVTTNPLHFDGQINDQNYRCMHAKEERPPLLESPLYSVTWHSYVHFTFCDKMLVTLENNLYLDAFSRKRGIIKSYIQPLCIEFSSSKCCLKIGALFSNSFFMAFSKSRAFVVLNSSGRFLWAAKPVGNKPRGNEAGEGFMYSLQWAALISPLIYL